MTEQERTEEVHYCLALLRTRGNENVPRESVASYLDVQASGAAREGYDCLARAFRSARNLVANGLEWEAARSVLEQEARNWAFDALEAR